MQAVLDAERWLLVSGRWEKSNTADGPVDIFTIQTTAAGENMQALHDRKPVMLPNGDCARWLDLEPSVADIFAAHARSSIKAERYVSEPRPALF